MGDATSPKPWRLFIAICIPDEVKTQIHKAQDELRRLLAEQPIRWTGRNQLHLTLRFLGNVHASQVDALVEAVRRGCLGTAAIELSAQRIGCFPQHGLPRVVWVAIDDPSEKLNRLQQAIETATRPFTTEPAEAKFTGHVTLARIKVPNRRQAQILSQFASRMADCSFGRWLADRVEIMRSELSSKGARHSGVVTIPLANLT